MPRHPGSSAHTWWSLAFGALIVIAAITFISIYLFECRREREELVKTCLTVRPAYECAAMFRNYCTIPLR